MTHQSPGMGETIPEDEKAWETAKQEAIAAVAPTEVPDPAATRRRVERIEAEAIPEDVLALAEKAYLDAVYMTTEDMPQKMVEMVASAILAERERCAKVCDRIADDHGKWKLDMTSAEAAEECAAAIRKPTP